MDWFVVLAPLLLLPIVGLFVFVGCTLPHTPLALHTVTVTLDLRDNPEGDPVPLARVMMITFLITRSDLPGSETLSIQPTPNPSTVILTTSSGTWAGRSDERTTGRRFFGASADVPVLSTRTWTATCTLATTPTATNPRPATITMRPDASGTTDLRFVLTMIHTSGNLQLTAS